MSKGQKHKQITIYSLCINLSWKQRGNCNNFLRFNLKLKNATEMSYFCLTCRRVFLLSCNIFSISLFLVCSKLSLYFRTFSFQSRCIQSTIDANSLKTFFKAFLKRYHFYSFLWGYYTVCLEGEKCLVI